MTGIYILENKINDKCYVGQSIDVNKRLIRHKCHGNCKNNKMLINRAISKYGWDNFEKLIFPFSEVYLDKAEQFVIQIQNSIVPNGYNLETGGHDNKHVTEETKKKISAANAGEKNPMFGKTGEKAPSYGKKCPEQSKRVSGEKNPCYGRTGNKHPMFGKKGEKHPASKLTDKQREEIVQDGRTLKEIATEYNVGIMAIHRIKQGRTI
jgi:group I intron endonuclease